MKLPPDSPKYVLSIWDHGNAYGSPSSPRIVTSVTNCNVRTGYEKLEITTAFPSEEWEGIEWSNCFLWKNRDNENCKNHIFEFRLVNKEEN